MKAVIKEQSKEWFQTSGVPCSDESWGSGTVFNDGSNVISTAIDVDGILDILMEELPSAEIDSIEEVTSRTMAPEASPSSVPARGTVRPSPTTAVSAGIV